MTAFLNFLTFSNNMRGKRYDRYIGPFIIALFALGFFVVYFVVLKKEVGESLWTQKDGAFTVITGDVKIDLLEEGEGAILKEDDRASVNYKALLPDGTVFDSGNAFSVKIRDESAPEWARAIVGMRVGEKRRVTISDLSFEIELLKIN